MNSDEGRAVRVGTVTGCGLSPLKGAAHAHPDRVVVRRHEVLGDRRWACSELRRGDVRVMRTVEVPAIMTVRAQVDDGGGLRMDLPDGRVFFVSRPDGPALLADYWGRRVRVHPASGPWNSALSTLLGREVELVAVERAGGVVYAEPVSIVTTSSLRELARRAGLTSIDEERFRSSIVVDTGGLPPFVEQSWVGGRLRIGGVDLPVRRQLARCAVIGFEPGSGQTTGPDLLRLLAADRTTASGIVFGVGADVDAPGEIAVGAAVDMETWEEFAVVTGGAAAALTGLLFVAVSIRLDVIAASTDLRSRAAQTLTLFLSVTLVAVLFAIPGQPEWLLGVELIALAIACGVMLFVLARRARRNASQQALARMLDAISPNVLTMALIGLGGLLTAVGLGWGLYLQVPAVIAALVGGVVSAWLFMMSTGEAPPARDHP